MQQRAVGVLADAAEVSPSSLHPRRHTPSTTRTPPPRPRRRRHRIGVRAVPDRETQVMLGYQRRTRRLVIDREGHHLHPHLGKRAVLAVAHQLHALQHTVSPGERLRLITTRSELLDELARRDPERFQRWLDSGARAASDPARFLTHLHHTPPCPTNTANRDRRFTVRLHSRRRHRHCADGPQRR